MGGLVFIPVPKKGNAKERSNYCTTAFISHASKVMLKILQDRLQARILEWVAMPFPGHLPDPGIKPGSCIAGRFFTI